MKKVNLLLFGFTLVSLSAFSQQVATTLSSNTDSYMKYYENSNETTTEAIAPDDIRGMIDLNIMNLNDNQIQVVLDSEVRDTGIVRIVNVDTGKRIRRKVSFFKGQIKIPLQDADKGIYEVQVKSDNSSNKIKKRFSVK